MIYDLIIVYSKVFIICMCNMYNTCTYIFVGLVVNPNTFPGKGGIRVRGWRRSVKCFSISYFCPPEGRERNGFSTFLQEYFPSRPPSAHDAWRAQNAVEMLKVDLNAVFRSR